MQTQENETGRGFTLALSAYVLWGFFPLVLKLLDHVDPVEVIAHRVVWAVPFAALLLSWSRRWMGIPTVLRAPRQLAMAGVTAAIISFNWGVYVYAVNTDRVLETALGYYINPLITVLLGFLLLGERPNRPQAAAIGLAAVAVLLLAVKAGGLPWISLSLAVSFAIYGLFRKIMPIGAMEGFFLEVAILLPPAAACILWRETSGEGAFLANAVDASLLIAIGPFTAAALIMFAAGARLLHFSTLGILQYASPTIAFLIAIFVFGEPFTLWQLAAFALIWTALAIYTWTLFRKKGAARRTAARA